MPRIPGPLALRRGLTRGRARLDIRLQARIGATNAAQRGRGATAPPFLAELRSIGAVADSDRDAPIARPARDAALKERARVQRASQRDVLLRRRAAASTELSASGVELFVGDDLDARLLHQVRDQL